MVPACGQHGAASHRAHLTEASARSTARAYFGRTKIGRICAHIGPKDGANSKPGPTCAVPPIEPRAPLTEGAQRSAQRADRSNCAPAQVGHACGELPAVRLGPPDGSNHANGSVSETLEMIVLQSKVGFSPDLESTRLWERDFKRQATLGQRLQISEYGLQVLGVSCSLLTCAALRMICCSRHHWGSLTYS